MTIPDVTTERNSRPKCRHCGYPAPQWVSTCLKCGNRVTPTGSDPFQLNPADHLREIIASVVLFGVTLTALMLLTVGSSGSLSVSTLRGILLGQDLPTTFLRLVTLGIPAVCVLWNWYRLMHTPQPDYGKLWRVYLVAQLGTVFGLLALGCLGGLLQMWRWGGY